MMDLLLLSIGARTDGVKWLPKDVSASSAEEKEGWSRKEEKLTCRRRRPLRGSTAEERPYRNPEALACTSRDDKWWP